MEAWAHPVTILPGESISSWMARAALIQGCDPLSLTGSLWPQWRTWTLDIDRGIDAEKLQILSRASGIPLIKFEQASLRAEAELIVGHQLADVGTWPWVLALGSRNRKRLASVQYCPACLSEDAQPYFRRVWRFAWQTVCIFHQTRLIDRCWSCGAAVEPHRLLAIDGHLGICVRCKVDLRLAQRLPISSGACNFQRNAITVIENSSGNFDAKILAAHEWFFLARFFVGLVRYFARNSTSCISNALRNLQVPISYPLPIFSVQLELLSLRQREILFSSVNYLMALRSSDIFNALHDAGVSENSLLAVNRTLPPSLIKYVNSLPIKRTCRRKRQEYIGRPKSKHSVLMSWARLRRKAGILPDE